MSDFVSSEELHHELPSPIRKIGVIYCTSPQTPPGRETEKLADSEIVDAAYAVQSALVGFGFEAELVELDPGRIADLKRFDWVYNLTETIFGFPLADYEIARQMETLGIPFTGSGSQTLRDCLDKSVTKRELLHCGIVTPSYEVIQPGQPVLDSHRYPLFIKPIHEDGSIGIEHESILHSQADLERQVGRIHSLYSQAALIEEYIDGRDITASILGNGQSALVLPLSEIIYPARDDLNILTFDAKWINDSIDYRLSIAHCPCVLPEQVEMIIKETALRAYHALGCRDYARVDFRVDGHRAYVLEVNPNPCINPHDSGFVRSASAAGYTYDEMVRHILESAIQDRLKTVHTANREIREYQDQESD